MPRVQCIFVLVGYTFKYIRRFVQFNFFNDKIRQYLWSARSWILVENRDNELWSWYVHGISTIKFNSVHSVSRVHTIYKNTNTQTTGNVVWSLEMPCGGIEPANAAQQAISQYLLCSCANAKRWKLNANMQIKCFCNRCDTMNSFQFHSFASLCLQCFNISKILNS